MRRNIEQHLLNPPPGSRAAAARDFGIDLTLILRNLDLTPAQRLRSNERAVNDLLKFEDAMRAAKRGRKRQQNDRVG